MAGIFVSYRREDAAAEAGRLFYELTDHFGEDNVFMDVGGLTPGTEFAAVIEQVVGACDAVVVLIGPRWLRACDAEGKRRIDDANDYVRLEIAAALAKCKPVIPVLVQGASTPHAVELRVELRGLARRNAIELSEANWSTQVELLVNALRQISAAAPTAAVAANPATRRRGTENPSIVKVMAALVDAGQQRVPAAGLSAEPQMDAHQVFVSYAFEDNEMAYGLVRAVEARGHKCWIAPRDIPPGAPSYARVITRAIKTSRLMVVIVSEHSNHSDDVLNEVTLGKNHKIPQLPFRIDHSPLDDGFEYFFSQCQWLDAATMGKEEAMATLAEAIAGQIS